MEDRGINLNAYVKITEANGYKLGCKETADKILNDLWKERNAIGQLMIFEEHLKEKAKEFGVEIKE